jgi:hypothetical protein
LTAYCHDANQEPLTIKQNQSVLPFYIQDVHNLATSTVQISHRRDLAAALPFALLVFAIFDAFVFAAICAEQVSLRVSIKTYY